MLEEALNRIEKAKAERSVKLDLKYMELKEIPMGVFDLHWLQSLDLRHNQISSIPSEIRSLTKLEELHLNFNNLSNLPDEIYALQNLSHLCVGANNLTEIPERLVELKKLNQFVVFNNNIYELPEVFKQKRDLDLRLSDNNIVNIPSYYLNNYYDLNRKRFSWESTFAFGFLYEKRELDKESKSKNANKIVPLIEELKSFLLGNNKQELVSPDFIIFQDCKILIDYAKAKEFVVYIDGDNYKTALQAIIKKVDELFDESKKYLSLEERYFYHPKNSIKINYDYLLTLRSVGEKTYVDSSEGDKYDIEELLSIVEDGAWIEENDSILHKKRQEFNKSPNAKEYLSNVEIRNFKIFSSISLELDKDVNIILANNGLGKTSILQAITIGLLPSDNRDKYSDFEDYIKFGFKKSDIVTKWGEYERNLWFYFDNLHEKETTYNPQPVLLAYGANIYVDSHRDTNSIVNKLIQGHNRLYDTRSIFSNNYDKFYDPLQVLNKLNLEANKAEEGESTKIIAQQIISELTDKLNYFLSLNNEAESIQVYHSSRGGYYFKGFGQENLKLKHLSEGYRNNVLIISNILISIMSVRNAVEYISKDTSSFPIDEVYEKIKGVILIDEFDRHLHPTWQRKLVNALKKVFKNIQFILTTHNAVSILGRKKEQIHQLYWDNNHKVSVYPYHQRGTETMSAGLALLIYYGLESILSPEMQEKVERYNEFERTGNTNSKEYKDLKLEISDSYLGQNINSKQYLAFINFLRNKGIENKEFAKFESKLTQAEIEELEQLLR